MNHPRPGSPQALSSTPTEAAILGSVLSEPTLAPRVLSRLAPGNFSDTRHRTIFEGISELAAADRSVNLVTLRDALGDRVDRAGGEGYISSLLDFLPDHYKIDEFIDVVKQKSVARLAVSACEDTINRLYRGEAPCAVLHSAEEILLGLSSELVETDEDHVTAGLSAALKRVVEGQGKKVWGISSGLTSLDAILRGFEAGRLVLLAGRPGMGKTSLAMNVAQHVALREGYPVLVFSLEMTSEEIATRIACSEADIDYERLRSGYLSSVEWERLFPALEAIEAAPIYIDDAPGGTFSALSAAMRRGVLERKAKLVVVDYLQLLSGGGENRTMELGAITRGMKLLARELGVTILALSQLSREPEKRVDKRPLLSDLRESGSLEQDADAVLFLYRDEVYNPNPANEGKAELIVSKHRHGKLGRCELAFLGGSTTFVELTQG